MKEARNITSYTELVETLSSTALSFYPSELHGIVTGLVAASTDRPKNWQKNLFNEELSEHDLHVLNELWDACRKQLDDDMLGFNLFLPSDEESLPVRAEALTLWCQGFLTGLKQAGAQLERMSSDELNDTIHDVVEVAKMDYDSVVTSEEDEIAYAELVEYIRMAAIFVHQEYHVSRQELGKTLESPDSDTWH